MWIFTPKGFLSIVQRNAMPGHFQVKSRTVEPLEHFWSGYDIEEIDWADYRFRITIQKKEAIEVLSRENEYIANPSHSYNESPNVYQASLIVTHYNGCLDTATHNIWVRNEFWI